MHITLTNTTATAAGTARATSTATPYELHENGFPTCKLMHYSTADTPCVGAPSVGAPSVAQVIYFHGGGFLFGSCSDLPTQARDAFAAANIEVFALDYPLAPHATLDQIVHFCQDATSLIISHFHLTKPVLFGRSAGAFLAYHVADALLDTPSAGIAAFYGFKDLTNPDFDKPSARYTALAPVDASVVGAAVTPLSEAPLAMAAEARYPIYVYARQKACWKQLIGATDSAGTLTSSSAQSLAHPLASFPPLFLAASTADEDVPFACSKRVWREKPGSVLKTYYDLPHEVDQFATPAKIQALYQELCQWIIEL